MLIDKQRTLFLNTITILAQAVELRDLYTGGHTHRVTSIAMLLAKEAKIDADEIEKFGRELRFTTSGKSASMMQSCANLANSPSKNQKS